MKIENTDVSIYGARQFTVTFEHCAIDNESEWMAGAALPFLDHNQVGLKEWTITLRVKGESREGIIQNCSQILALLLEPVELTLDGFSHHFKGTLKSHKRKEKVPKRYHLLELEFEGYECGEEVTVSGKNSLTITNPGNLISPCIVEITPLIGAASITLTGLCRDTSGADLPITIENLETGKSVILNGLTGLITQAGEQKGGEVSIWALPSMKPGENTVTVSNANMTVNVRTIPIYM